MRDFFDDKRAGYESLSTEELEERYYALHARALSEECELGLSDPLDCISYLRSDLRNPCVSESARLVIQEEIDGFAARLTSGPEYGADIGNHAGLDEAGLRMDVEHKWREAAELEAELKQRYRASCCVPDPLDRFGSGAGSDLEEEGDFSGPFINALEHAAYADPGNRSAMAALAAGYEVPDIGPSTIMYLDWLTLQLAPRGMFFVPDLSNPRWRG